MGTSHIASLALEWWRANGERSLERLHSLVGFFAETNGESEHVEHHYKIAESQVRNWERF